MLSKIQIEIKKYVKCIVCLILSLSMNLAQANPVLDNVAAGDVKIQQVENTVTVEQSSAKAIINWQSFNIAEHEKTHFQQPTNGITLNRVNPAQGISEIYGSLTATGKIILINGSGIHFGPTAHVNVGGLIASATSNISDHDFLEGNPSKDKFGYYYYILNNTSAYSGSIINEGNIKAEDYGLVALMGMSVINHGIIQARLGQVLLAGGDQYTVSFDEGLISFRLDNVENKTTEEAKTVNVTNTGTILADGGSVMLTAAAAVNVLNNVINMDGVIEANSVAEHNGIIELRNANEYGHAGNNDNAIMNVKGKLSATGYDDVASRGGAITIYSKNIVIQNAEINVSGNKSGGIVHIVAEKRLLFDRDSTIFADAIINGHGGYIVLGGTYTDVLGKIYARGGNEGGHGGFVILSGYEEVIFSSKQLDLTAPHGQAGGWWEIVGNIWID